LKDFKTFTPEEAVGEIISECGGKSEGEIMSRIFSIAEEKRRSGQLTDGEIDSFYSNFSKSLSAAQKKKFL